MTPSPAHPQKGRQTMYTDIAKALGIRYPILQGAMGHITGGAMAAAVTNAGALGTIASADQPVEAVRREYQIAKAATTGPVALNIPFKKSPTGALAEMVVEEGVDIVVVSAGDPKDLIPEWKRHHVKVMAVAASVEHAVKLEQAGVDFLIAEGLESGGRIGRMTTMALLPQVVDAVSIPVIAAGGIADGRGMAAAFDLGASGIQMGTRFLFAQECPIHENFRQAILQARASDTVVSGRPYRIGGEARILRNALYEESIQLERQGADDEAYERLFKNSMPRAVVEGDIQHGSPMVGSIVGMLHRIEPIDAIIQGILQEYRALAPRPVL